MGDRRIHARARGGGPYGRIDRRPHRPPRHIRGRARDLRGRVAGRRARTRRHVPEHLARRGRNRRRGDVRCLPRHGGAGVRTRPGAGHGDGHLRRNDRRGRGRGAAGRRRDHRRVRLAVGVLPQRPDRHRRDRRDVRKAAGVARSERDSCRLGRARDVQHSAAAARAGAAARQRRRLDERDDRVAAGRGCGDARRVRGDRAARRGADAPARAVPQPGLHRRSARRVCGVGLAVRPVPVPHAVPAELPRLLAASGGAALPADHAGAVLRRAGRRRADGTTAGSGHDGDRPRRALAPGCC